MKFAHLLSSCLLAAACCGAVAHQDRVLQIRPDGTLDGLAPPYAPARLRLSFATVEGEPRISALALDLHGRRVEVPMCVLGLLNSERVAEVQASASWEHDETIVPPYLSLRFADPGQDPKADASSGYTLLFDLRSAKLIEMQIEVVHAARHRTQTVPVDLQARCGEADAATFLAPR